MNVHVLYARLCADKLAYAGYVWKLEANSRLPSMLSPPGSSLNLGYLSSKLWGPAYLNLPVLGFQAHAGHHAKLVDQNSGHGLNPDLFPESFLLHFPQDSVSPFSWDLFFLFAKYQLTIYGKEGKKPLRVCRKTNEENSKDRCIQVKDSRGMVPCAFWK